MADKNMNSTLEEKLAELEAENCKLREENGKLRANVNNINKLVAFSRGFGLLHRAAEKNDTEMCALLLDGGANIEETLEDYYNDHDWMRPLQVACWRGSLEVAKQLIQAGAKVNKVSGGEGRWKTHWGESPLHCAADNGHAGICELLLNEGADIEATDRDGHTPLHVACAKRHSEVVRTLIERRANLMARSREEEVTPLHLADRKVEIVELMLLKGGAELLEATDKNGNTVLHYAYMMNWEEKNAGVIELLLRSGANPKAVNKEGKVPNEVERPRYEYDMGELKGIGYKGLGYKERNIVR